MYWNPAEGMLAENVTRLTLTWDVLKFDVFFVVFNILFWLTLTWDVLKLHIKKPVMSCSIRLTLTWDVLKLGNDGQIYCTDWD